MKHLPLILLPVLLSGCLSFDSSRVPRGMRVATGDSVRDCRFLADVHGSSMFYGPLADTGIATARRQAFAKARSLGANTLVWGTISTLYGPTLVSANAYDCPMPAVTPAVAPAAAPASAVPAPPPAAAASAG